MTTAARDTPDRRAGREPARRPLTWFDSPEEQALIAPWNAGRGAPLADVRHAAEQGHIAAQHALAYRHEHGDGVPQDFAEAARWYRRAAERDNAIALNILGLLYCYGDGVERNVATAARTFRASAERGYAGGQGNIGHAYAVGVGVDQDDAQALHWLQLAAEGGRTVGLAVLHDLGQGVPQDFAEAARRREGQQTMTQQSPADDDAAMLSAEARAIGTLDRAADRLDCLIEQLDGREARVERRRRSRTCAQHRHHRQGEPTRCRMKSPRPPRAARRPARRSTPCAPAS